MASCDRRIARCNGVNWGPADGLCCFKHCAAAPKYRPSAPVGYEVWMRSEDGGTAGGGDGSGEADDDASTDGADTAAGTAGGARSLGAAGEGAKAYLARVHDRVAGSVLGALAADALSLRDHYEYSAARTLKRGIMTTYEDPRPNLTPGWHDGKPYLFHPKRVAGQQTDYGDNVLFVLDFLREQLYVRYPGHRRCMTGLH